MNANDVSPLLAKAILEIRDYYELMGWDVTEVLKKPLGSFLI